MNEVSDSGFVVVGKDLFHLYFRTYLYSISDQKMT